MKLISFTLFVLVQLTGFAQDQVQEFKDLYAAEKYKQAAKLADDLVQTQPKDSTILAYAAFAHYEFTAQGSPTLKESENTLKAIEAALEAKNDKKDLYLRLANTAYAMADAYTQPEEDQSILKFKGYINPEYRTQLRKLALDSYKKYADYKNPNLMASRSIAQRINELDDQLK
ncbi:MAG: hypothetical protein CMF34_01910 [Leeuwenhoekiella sp.]|nr:hypothetical protein [Leeuwenhoekiella sp.]MBH13581.1 hypothetical protein [Leeuwenhoekiella sp.]HAX15729.1 hypothetical protein [Leeuwenhoekiella sp.]|tara:strand:+ start:13295 stop:13813 length:519 start_codon:yes stop_codon:yes gene_type:complete